MSTSGICVPCDSQGYSIVPCRRDDPDRLYPDCGHREHPSLTGGGCYRPGCLEAVKVVPCRRCGDRRIEQVSAWGRDGVR